MIAELNGKRSLGLGAVAAALIAVAGCSPTVNPQPAPTPAMSQPAPIQPVQSASVQTTDLPPIAGTTSAPNVSPSTSPLPGSPATQNGQTGDTAPSGSTIGGRDLSGSISIEQLLGGWTIQAGAEQCRLNLTYTAKGSTGRYRASTPACNEPTLTTVTSWNLLGNQIQLYNEADELVGTLLRSGDRFMGTLAGGQAISLVG